MTHKIYSSIYGFYRHSIRSCLAVFNRVGFFVDGRKYYFSSLGTVCPCSPSTKHERGMVLKTTNTSCFKRLPDPLNQQVHRAGGTSNNKTTNNCALNRWTSQESNIKTTRHIWTTSVVSTAHHTDDNLHKLLSASYLSVETCSTIQEIPEARKQK